LHGRNIHRLLIGGYAQNEIFQYYNQ